MKFRNFIENLMGSKVKVKVLAHIMAQENITSERAVARQLGVSHTPVVKALKEFHELNLISPMGVGKAIVWKINTQSYAYAFLSNFLLYMKTRKTPLEDLKAEIKPALGHVLGVKKSIIYGSVAEGSERADSDVDLFVLVGDEKTKKAVLSILHDLGVLCVTRYGNNLSPTVFTEKEIKQSKHRKLVENISRGIEVI